MPKGYAPTIWDCRDLSGIPFQLTSLTFRSLGKPGYGFGDEFKGIDGRRTVKLRLADPLLNAQKRGNVLIEQEGQWVPFDEYLDADPQTGHGTYQTPRKNIKTGEIERWPDTGNVKTEGKWEFVVVAMIRLLAPATLKKQFGKKAGEIIGEGTEFELHLKPSAYRSLHELIATTQKTIPEKNILNAVWTLTYTAGAAPADTYKVEFTAWGSAPVAAPTEETGTFTAEEHQIDDIPF